MSRYVGICLLGMAWMGGVGGVLIPCAAEAGQMRLQLTGITGDGTSTPLSSLNGNLINAGTSWSLVADFPSPTTFTENDFHFSGIIALTVHLGSTTSTITSPGSLQVVFKDLGGSFLAAVYKPDGQQAAIAPLFENSANAAWDPSIPTATEFTNFVGFFVPDEGTAETNSLTLSTDLGTLVLTAAASSSTSASITGTAIPEPSVVGLAVCGLACGVVLSRRSRR